MKYLKSYSSITESIASQILPDLDDILLELTDLGYEYMVETRNFSGKDKPSLISITIYNTPSVSKDWVVILDSDKDVIDTLERLVDYLSTDKYRLEEDSHDKMNKVRKFGIGDVISSFGNFTLNFRKS